MVMKEGTKVVTVRLHEDDKLNSKKKPTKRIGRLITS